MSKKNRKLEFRKSIDWDSVNDSNIPRPKNKYKNKEILIQRQRAKDKLINQYNMSEIEAERTLQNIEKRAREKRNKEFSSRKLQKKEINSNEKRYEIENEKRKRRIQEFIEEEDADIIIPEHVKDRQKNEIDENQTPITIEKDKKTEKPYPAIVKESNKQEEKPYPPTVKESNKYKETSENQKNHKNVDDILSKVIPDYEKQLSIEVNDVSLTFEIEKDKIDNLKEFVIRTMKRNKKEKFKIHALKNISFNVYKGEKIGIIGYNGAGKSTLLNVITGIYYPDTGCVKTNGKISPMLSLGAGFDHNYTGRENIFLNGAVLGYDKNFLKSKVDEIIEFSELGEYIDIPIKNYSSGMLAKLGFSIATIVEPDILIIDEVLGVGDVTFRKKSSDKIKSLMDGKTTVLLVSHSISQIRELCDKAIWIDKGEMREIGEVNEVCDHYLKDAEKATKEQLKNIQLK